MARLARVVLPGVPHHVTQRGNRRQPVFFEPDDYRLYLRLIAAAAARARTEIWAYCLMPNHVHLIACPADADGLRATFAEAHRRYTGAIHARFGWTGHLFQARFGAVAMDERHLCAALRYVALNPVAAGLAARAEDWPWSSARAQLTGAEDAVVRIAALGDRVPPLAPLLDGGEDAEAAGRLRRAGSIGRPLGSADWLAEVERRLGRVLRPGKRGPKPRGEGEVEVVGRLPGI